MSANEDEGASQTVVRFLQNQIVKVVQDGVGPITGSVPYAEARLSKAGPAPDDAAIERVIDRLTAESVAASSTNGFVTGLGGFVAMPVTIPANVAGSLVINARLVGAIAHLRGYDLTDPHVQSIVTLTTAGGTLAGTLHSVGVQVGAKLTAQAIKSIPIAVIRAINTRVGFMLLAKYGTQRSVLTLAKAIPVAGGLVGAGVDATLTALVARTARANFPAHV
ncbi:MAG TPA: EcsC family protein [Actinoplanes sp.]|nr:EcsC family protein [Actinoplanes sp.]